jgi:hypothetical protein
MSIQVQAAIIAAVAGLLSGTLGSLVAPWVNWRIETRRELLKERTARLSEWRTGLAKAEGGPPLNERKFLSEPWYLSLRPRLDTAFRTYLEGVGSTANVRVTSEYRPAIGVQLSDEIDRIPREWNLA